MTVFGQNFCNAKAGEERLDDVTCFADLSDGPPTYGRAAIPQGMQSYGPFWEMPETVTESFYLQ